VRNWLVFVWCACAAPQAEAPPPKEVTAAAKEAPLPSPAPAAKKGVIARAELTPFLDRGPGAFLQHLDVTPRFSGGRFQGWRLASFFPGDERFAGVDLQPGDVIQRVNGRSVEKPEELAEVWQSLRTAPALEVSLLRNGAPITLRWPIEP
jgi:type II secretory pathway component PulC